MSHLGRWLTALVDGELDGTERDRVLNHIAGCDACRQEVNAMRTLKRRLTALGETSAEPTITSRLIELARDQVPAVRAEHRPVRHPGPQPGPPARRGQRQLMQAWRIAAGSAGSALLAIGVTAFLLGSGSANPPAPKITPSVDSYLLQHAYDAGQAPAAGPGSVSSSTSAAQAPQGTAAPGKPSPEQVKQQLAVLAGVASPTPVTTAAARPVSSAAAHPVVPSFGLASNSPGTRVASRTSR